MGVEKVFKILMLEDLQDDVGLIERALRKEGMHFSSKRVDTEEEFTQCLSSFQPDVRGTSGGQVNFNSGLSC